VWAIDGPSIGKLSISGELAVDDGVPLAAHGPRAAVWTGSAVTIFDPASASPPRRSGPVEAPWEVDVLMDPAGVVVSLDELGLQRLTYVP
jgi:hypothetical protein